jgi:hypothetical protein
MDGKYTYYDLVAHLVPGTLLIAVLALLPEVFGFSLSRPHSSVVIVVGGLPLAYVAGQVMQALSSFMQPIYYRLWGGMPSGRIAAGESRRLRGERLDRIMDTLGSRFNSPSSTPTHREDLFADAMALCNRHELGRVAEFNASYAFHRALFTTGAIATVILGVGLALAELGVTSVSQDLRASLIYFVVLAVALTIAEYVRARQRGEYFAVEVLNIAYVYCVTEATPRVVTP